MSLLLATFLAAAQPAGAVAAPTTEALVGSWSVDLRPKPDAPAYLKLMRLDRAGPDGVAGTFYDSPIQAGRANADKGRPCFAFTTTDGSGPYFTTGCLVGDRIEGVSYSEARGFLLNWTAERAR